MTGVTQTLARFAVEHPHTAIPVATRNVMLRRFAGVVAAATAGSGQYGPDLIRRTLARFSNDKQVSLLGRPERLGLCDAPVVTAAAIYAARHALDELPGDNWADGCVMAAALATAEYTGARGTDLLDAVVIGTELGLRVERGMSPAFANAGWAPGGVAARLGAAAAAGRLLALDLGQMVSALGLAATQAAGFASSSMTQAGTVAAGKAAGDGVEAALLAGAGFNGPAAPIEGRRGLAEVLTPIGHDVPSMTDALGDAWLADALPDDGGLVQPPPCSRAAVAIALEIDEQDGVERLLAASRDDSAG